MKMKKIEKEKENLFPPSGKTKWSQWTYSSTSPLSFVKPVGIFPVKFFPDNILPSTKVTDFSIDKWQFFLDTLCDYILEEKGKIYMQEIS